MIKLILDDNSIKKGKSGLITGDIYFETLQGYYPEKNWNDFVMIILSWWANSFVDFLQGNQKEMEFHFMDGPYCAYISKSGENMLNFQFNRDEVVLCLFKESICLYDLYKILLDNCRKAIESLSILGIESTNVEGLRKTYEKLKLVTI